MVITPNLPEAGVLLDREIKTVDDDLGRTGAAPFRQSDCAGQGGHLPGEEMVDVF